MRKTVYLLPILFCVYGCATFTHVARTILPVNCSPDIKPAPAYADNADAIKAAAGIEPRVRLLIAGRIQRDDRIAELDGALKACELPDF